MSDSVVAGQKGASEPDRQEDSSHSLTGTVDRQHPIEIAIKKFAHRIRDIEGCIRFLPRLREQQNSEADALLQELRSINAGVKEERQKIGLVGYFEKVLAQSLLQIDRFVNARPDHVMRFSLFLGLFASLDAYMGDLLTGLFYCRPELFNRIGKDIPFREIVSAQSIKEVKSRVLTEFIDKFRRDSYIDQFETMQKMFSIELKKFDRWAVFVEASQRRNVVAHCDGIVSQQYLENCRRAGCDIPTIVSAGSLLEVTDDYLGVCCRVVMEVGVKLGHTLWRKLLPEELSTAERHLDWLAYQALQLEEWSWAAVLGEFAIGQRNFSSDLSERVAIINYAIAIRYRDNPEAATKVMSTKDWSASAAEFRLAEAILKDDEKLAAKIMREIGKNRRLLEGETSYVAWPIFREFRGTKVFLETYQEIYGHDFITELQREVAQIDQKNDPDLSSNEQGDS
jgi:hypothetical protein